MNNYAKELRRLLAENKFLTLPGVYDCLSARIAQEAGFPALFLSGGALAYSVLGKPDFGFLSLAEFGDAIQHIVSACRAPLLADADNGFGNAIQAANTGAVYEQLGAAGLQIDDKVLPASHPARNEIVDWEMIGPKIQAVRDSVSDDFVIVYRTCANLYGYGVEESIRRINLARERGADYAYVDGIKSMEELKKISDEAAIPLMVNLNEKGFVGGNVPIEEVKALRYSIGLFPISSMLAAAQGMIEVMGALADRGSTLSVRDKMTDPPTRIHNMMGQTALVEKYAPYYTL
ncbi:MAG: isocitrate lyase/PEP mutase family protein [Lawsonibacter sp.]|jgi:methylisocitrate lyase|nr:isocitrate lyase/PEP mutase family protein [Lawsonibacter sp.]MCI9293693.1 isocitrate lyase/PEP mutase family protein [Lawsonibacter sp.]MCI9654785.1 isocitrate lyase/PEP mutase family protein [Lawsonibacter sp.]MDE6899226.1 isocitrate lyase/PEP mutase family protein [Lawsonibacter sp.]